MANGYLLISEWLPNPLGDDAKGEWIELWNSGSEPVNLSEYSLAVSSGKTFSLKGVILGGERKVFSRAETKLTLKNSGEIVTLKKLGQIVDESRLLAPAPEGKSWSRDVSGIFSLSEPTPDYMNAASLSVSVKDTHSPGDIIVAPLGPRDIVPASFAVGLLLMLFMRYLLRHDPSFSYLFQKGDNSSRGESGAFPSISKEESNHNDPFR